MERIGELRTRRQRLVVRIVWSLAFLRSRRALINIVMGLAFLIIVICGYLFDWKWTGLDQSKVNGEIQPAKTLWDWLDLLIVPVVLAIGGYLFNSSQNRATQEATKRREQDEALQAYLDKIGELLLDNKLRALRAGKEARTLARAQTVTVLKRLDVEHNRSVLHFLRDSRLVDDPNNPIVSFSYADLGHADLRQADLRGADLRHANLVGTFFRGADLRGANLRGADLGNASLVDANLEGADLRGADLSGAYLTGADLERADLRDAHLWSADLSFAELAGADLAGADLTYANLVHLQDRFWAMSSSAAYESAERTTRSLVNAHKASLSITQKVS
jgi:uncharacterized protein YjbI with pentapeptide repeats